MPNHAQSIDEVQSIVNGALLLHGAHTEIERDLAATALPELPVNTVK